MLDVTSIVYADTMSSLCSIGLWGQTVNDKHPIQDQTDTLYLYSVRNFLTYPMLDVTNIVYVDTMSLLCSIGLWGQTVNDKHLLRDQTDTLYLYSIRNFLTYPMLDVTNIVYADTMFSLCFIELWGQTVNDKHLIRKQTDTRVRDGL